MDQTELHLEEDEVVLVILCNEAIESLPLPLIYSFIFRATLESSIDYAIVLTVHEDVVTVMYDLRYVFSLSGPRTS